MAKSFGGQQSFAKSGNALRRPRGGAGRERTLKLTERVEIRNWNAKEAARVCVCVGAVHGVCVCREQGRAVGRGLSVYEARGETNTGLH